MVLFSNIIYLVYYAHKKSSSKVSLCFQYVEYLYLFTKIWEDIKRQTLAFSLVSFGIIFSFWGIFGIFDITIQSLKYLINRNNIMIK